MSRKKMTDRTLIGSLMPKKGIQTLQGARCTVVASMLDRRASPSLQAGGRLLTFLATTITNDAHLVDSSRIK
jgi:hypothetical protein